MRSLFARLHRRYGKKITGDERQTFVAKLVEKERKELAHACEAKPEAYRGKRPRVAIVGAGFAGLMAGYTLRKQFNITIFEARDRIGGRVWSKSKSSGIVEAGAELIGYNHPLWMLLGREFELGFSVNTSDTNFDALHLEMPLRLDGHRIRKDSSKACTTRWTRRSRRWRGRRSTSVRGIPGRPPGRGILTICPLPIGSTICI